ncbi:MAG: hypothetical protein WED00_08560 [Aquisalimonadaceae bacterium]
MDEQSNAYDDAARDVVAVANRLADADDDADLHDIADGLLAGAIHYWLYAHQPCDDPRCVDCAPLRTAEWRLRELMDMVEEMARGSEYFHSPDDMTAGSA